MSVLRPNTRRLTGIVVLLLVAAVTGWRVGGWARARLRPMAGSHDPSFQVDQRPPANLLGGSGPDAGAIVKEDADGARWVRGSDEWQGMRPQRADWPCAADGTCSMARACVNGRCVPCVADRECETGEICALGHCVLQEHADCSRRADCETAEARCVLSGYTAASPRGNRDMRAVCLEPSGAWPFPLEQAKLPRSTTKPLPTPVERIEARLRESLSARSER